MESELTSPQQFPTVKVHSTVLWKKGVTTFLLSQMDLSGSVRHLCQCFRCWDLSSFCSSFGKCLFYTFNLEILNFKSTRQDLKLRNSVHMGRCVGGVCNFLGSVLLQQKFEATDGPVLQLCVTVQFYLVSKGKYMLAAWGQTDPKTWTEAPSSILALLFMFFFSPPSEPALCKLG